MRQPAWTLDSDEPKTAFAVLHETPVGDHARVEVYDESLFGICLVMADTRVSRLGLKSN